MISILLILIAALFNAIMDVISFHYSRSVFSGLGYDKWLDPYISWRNKYNNGKPELGRNAIPIFLTDVWHFAKSSMLTCIILAIVLYNPVIGRIWDFTIMGFGWIIVFNSFYNKILIK